jgi:tetratricopeptide (TPR) repeat protein
LDTPTPCKISLFVSTDGGNNWQGPLKKIDNNYTESVTKGTHEIVWNVLEEFDNLSGNNITFQVKAVELLNTETQTYFLNDEQEKTYQDEIDKLSKKIKLNPKNAKAYLKRAELKVRFRLDEYYSSAFKDINKAILLNPKDGYAFKFRSWLNYQGFNSSINDINKAILLNPKDSQNYIVKASFLQQAVEDSLKLNLTYNDAIKYYTNAIDLNPKDGLAYLLRSKCKFYLNNFEDAVKDIDSALFLGCNDLSFALNLINDDFYASCYFERSRIKYIMSKQNNSTFLNQSFEDINKYLEIKSFNSFFDLENIYDFETMLIFLDQYINKLPNEANAYFERAVYKTKTSKYLNIDSDFETFFTLMKLKNADRDEINLNRYIRLNNDQNEILFINKAVELLKTADTYLLRGIYKKEKDDFKGAIDDFNKAIEISPETFIYSERGDVKYELKNYNGAIADYNNAIDLFPNYPDHYEDRGDAKFELKDYKGAITDYSKAIELNNKRFRFYGRRGAAKYELNDDYGAISDFTKAISLSSSFIQRQSYYYHYRGIAKFNTRDYSGAILDITKAISLDPKEGLYFYNRGNAKIKLKDKIGGCKDFSKAGELGYDDAYQSIKENCY